MTLLVAVDITLYKVGSKENVRKEWGMLIEETGQIKVLFWMDWDNAYGYNWNSIYDKFCCRTFLYFM